MAFQETEGGVGGCALGARALILIRKKTILGDTCSRLVWTKHLVASSNTNIYDRKSTFFGPDGSSGQLAIKHATGAVKSLFGVSRWRHINLQLLASGTGSR